MNTLPMKKKGMTTIEIIMWIVIILVVASLILSKGGVVGYLKALFGLGGIVVDPYQACHGKLDGASCKTKEITDGVCSNGQCVVRNSPAYTLEHARLLFKTALKQNLELCKGNVNACAEAGRTIENILSFVDDDGEGKVYMIVEKLAADKAEFRLYKKLGFFSFGSGALDSFQYDANLCFLKADDTDHSVPQIGIVKQPDSLYVFDSTNVANKKDWYTFIAIKHKDANAASDVCIQYNKK